MADTDYLAASDGTGDAALMHVTSPRTIGATIIQVDSVVGVPAFFIGTYGTLGSDGFITAASKRDFFGHVNAGTLVIDKFAAGNTDAGNTAGQVVVIKPNTTSQNLISDFIKNGVVAGGGSWNVLGPTPDTVTALGNRSYSLVFNARDLTSSLAAGMRLRLTRTTPAPTQCTLLNGTNQNWSKTTPAGTIGTITDDITFYARVKLTSYQQGGIISKYNGTSGFVFYVGSNGVLRMGGYNAGNSREWNTQQTLPLNKWVTISGSLDMSGNTTATNKMMIDGVDVPIALTSVGTPAAFVQAGNLEIGSFAGANFFAGKIAQAWVGNGNVTTITQATILAMEGQSITGAEANCIGAWSFNASSNDLTANANNLSAGGAAVATNADSPFGGQASGIFSATTTYEYAIITKSSFSTNTTLVVQVPEGCAIPTNSSGVNAVSSSNAKAPYGMPVQRRKWAVELLWKSRVSAAAGTQNLWTNLWHVLNIPLGEWAWSYSTKVANTHAGVVFLGGALGLSTANNTVTEFDSMAYTPLSNTAMTEVDAQVSNAGHLSLSAATPYYLNQAPQNNAQTVYIGDVNGSIGVGYIRAELAYL